MISSNTELILIVNRWAVANCLTTNSDRRSITFHDYLHNKLPEAKWTRKCVIFTCWNAFSVLNIWLLAQQCKVNFPPEYYIVWLFTKIVCIKPLYEVVGCYSL